MAANRNGMSRREISRKSFVGETVLDRETTLIELPPIKIPSPARPSKELTRRIPAFAVSVFVAVSALAFTFAALSMHAPQVSAYSPHAPIDIRLNTSFTLANGVTSGSGTQADPYVISGWEILTDTAEGIYIHETTAYFVIRDVYIHGTGSYYGIHFGLVTNGAIINCTLTTNLQGIRLDDSRYVTIADNNIDDQSDSGIVLSYSRDLTIHNNSVDRNAYAIYAGNSVRDVSITDNSMDDSTYGGLVVLGQALRFSVTGNTVRSTTSGNGIDIEDTATDVEILDNNVSGNSGSGIWYALDVYSNAIRNNTVLDNAGGDGIHIEVGSGNAIENNTVARNLNDGIAIDQSISAGQNYIANNSLTGNSWGLSCLVSNAYQIINNAVAGNSAGGIIYSGSGSTIALNTISDNDDYGLYLDETSQSNTITGNTFIHDGMYGRFISSDGNVISGNTVNARPLVFLDKVNSYTVVAAGQVVVKDSDNITISGQNLSSASVGVQLWNSVDCTVLGTSMNGGLYGISIEAASHRNHVVSCNLSDNYIGVFASLSDQNLIERNTINDSLYAGVMLGSTSNNSFMGNELAGGGGFQLTQCTMTTIQGNSMTNTGFGVMVFSSSNITIALNRLLNAGAEGVYLYEGSQCMISSNLINTGGHGIYLAYDSNSNFIWNNSITGNNEGIYFTGFDSAHPSRLNTITGNNISGNAVDGIWLQYAQGNTISWNNVSGNGYGIRLNSTSTSANRLFLNNFTGNAVNAYSDCPAGSNYWNTSVMFDYTYGGKPFNGYLGNRYGDYSGLDPDGNGVGNTPYTVGKEQDMYPLMGMPTIVIPEFPSLMVPVIALLAILSGIGIASGRMRNP
jgi:parallel beta-helix repeat protein